MKNIYNSLTSFFGGYHSINIGSKHFSCYLQIENSGGLVYEFDLSDLNFKSNGWLTVNKGRILDTLYINRNKLSKELESSDCKYNLIVSDKNLIRSYIYELALLKQVSNYKAIAYDFIVTSSSKYSTYRYIKPTELFS